MSARARRAGGPSLILLLLCAVSGYAAYLEWSGVPVLDRIFFSSESPPATAAPAGATGSVPAGGPQRALPGLPPLDEFAEVAERTLFNPTRRPIEPPEVDKAQIVKPSLFTLIGILISDGERMALIRRGRAADYLQVREGEEIDGWRVERIAPDRIVIRKGDTQEDVVLKDRTEPLPKARTKRPRLRPDLKKLSPGQVK